MKKYKLKPLIFACIFAFTSVSSGYTVFADTEEELQKEIDSNNDKLNELEDEQEAIEAEINAMSSELDDIMRQISEKSDELYALEITINEYTKAINEKIAEIDDINIQIDNKKLEIDAKKADLIKREEMLANRVRSYYKTDMTVEFINMIFEADSFADVFLIFNSINVLVSTDKDMMDQIQLAQEELEAAQAELENLLATVENEKSELEVVQASLENTKVIYEAEMDELAVLEADKIATLENLTEEEKSLANSIDDINEENAALEAKIQEIIRQNAVANAGSNSGGSNDNNFEDFQGEFLRPVSGPITSHFGYRTHPVTGIPSSFHKGIDYGAGFGTPIFASKSGTVIFSGVNGGYGNCVIIDHGDGTSTLYAHNQSNYVSYGQTVSQGQRIAAVGSTGTSTGPHLHFEIRINGEPVNPYSYIPY